MNPNWISEEDETFKCYTCGLVLETYYGREEHKRIAHNYSVKVYFLKEGEDRLAHYGLSKEELDKRMFLQHSIRGMFICPKCHCGFPGDDAYGRHLIDVHNGFCILEPESRKRKQAEIDRKNTDYANNTTSTNKRLTPNSAFSSLSSRSTTTATTAAPSSSTVCDANTSIQMASGPTDLSLLCQIGGWKPIIHTSESGKKYHLLTSQKVIEDILANEPSDKWTLPTS